MQYTEGQLGRVFVVRIDDGEDMIASLRQFIDEKAILAGSVIFLGALMEGKMVTGPRSRSFRRFPILSFLKAGGKYSASARFFPVKGDPTSITTPRWAAPATP